MKELPEAKDIETILNKESASINTSLSSTEEILKRLLFNLAAFKKIEQDNMLLRNQLLKNELQVKNEYKRKLEELSGALREKETLAKKGALAERYKRFADKLVHEIISEKRRSSFLDKKYKELFQVTKKIAGDNRALKSELKKQAMMRSVFEEKIRTHTGKLAQKYTDIQLMHKSLLRQYEEEKIEKDKRVVMEKRKSSILEKKYGDLSLAFTKMEADYRKISDLNRKCIERIAYLEKKSLANEELLKAREVMISGAYEGKLKELAKLYLDKEVDYKAKIESLNKDLVKYYAELKDSKFRYYAREKELKEKLKEVLS